MFKNNTIRFYRKYVFTPWQLAGKDFEIESFSTDQGMFDQRSCDVRLTVDVDLFKLFNGLGRDIEARVTLSDGTVYVLSELCQMSQMPVYDFYADVFDKPGSKFNTKLTFGNWQVYLPHKDEICSTNKHNCMVFDIASVLRNGIVEEAASKLDEEIYKSLGIDFGKDRDHTATAIVEAEKLKSLNHRYVYTKCEIDKLFNEYKPEVYKPDLSFYRSFWVDPGKIYTIKIDDTDKKDVNDLSKKEVKELVQKTNKEKENNTMKINNKELKQIIIDEDRKTVTTITEEAGQLTKAFGLEPVKKVAVAKASKDDEFDPYVGVAMTLAYQLFGSKENFRKFVRENELVRDLKKEREAREAAKQEAKKAAEDARKKAATRRAKQAKKDEETATELLEKLSKFFNKSKKTKTKKGE